MERVEAVMKGLLLKGYSLAKQFTLDLHTLTSKQKKVCLRPKKGGGEGGVVSEWAESPYEPEVWDLSRVDLRIDLRVTTNTRLHCMCNPIQCNIGVVPFQVM